MGTQQYGIDSKRLNEYAEQIKEIHDMGVEIGIVIGGGNIFRGLTGTKSGFDRVKGDNMGMLATVINGLAVQSALENVGTPVRLFTAITMEPVAERYSQRRCEEAFKNKAVAIFTFGTGNPFFTTDTASALRSVEIKADALLKGTRVDGVYTADPEKDPAAQKFDTISFDEVIAKGLKVMDLTAFAMCKENNLPVIVFDMNTHGNLKKIIQGENCGTVVS